MEWGQVAGLEEFVDLFLGTLFLKFFFRIYPVAN